MCWPSVWAVGPGLGSLRGPTSRGGSPGGEGGADLVVGGGGPACRRRVTPRCQGSSLVLQLRRQGKGRGTADCFPVKLLPCICAIDQARTVGPVRSFVSVKLTAYQGKLFTFPKFPFLVDILIFLVFQIFPDNYFSTDCFTG